MSERRPCALVTGASSGIGLAFALAFGRKGYDLALVSRGEDRLVEIANEISSATGINAVALPSDLSDPLAPDRLFEQLSARDLIVDCFVNNAGFGVPGNFLDVTWQRHRDTIEVMAAAPVRFSHLLAPSMMERGSGTIINVSSLAALLPPHAGGTLYYPVKSFLLQFSIALHEELRATGVNVTAVCPGFTETGFQAAAGGTVESVAFPKVLWMAPQTVAEAAIAAAEAGYPVCIPGLVNKAIALAFKVMPASIGRWLVRR